MQRTEATLTVYFEDPYWVGVYERHEDGRLTVCRLVFGVEPKDQEVHRYLLENWHRLRFGPPVHDGQRRVAARRNPKRMLREAARQMRETGVGTKAQQAMQLQREAGREARKRESRRQREERQRLQFALRQEKKREKHRGH